MKRIAMLSLGVILLSPAPARLWADETQPPMTDKGKPDPAKMVDHRLEHLTKKMKLTTEQQGQVKQVLQDEAAQMTPLHEQMKSIHQQSDEKINALLTDDQKKKFQEVKDKRKEKMGKRWSHKKEMTH